MRSVNFNFFKSFSKPPSVKQPIETINQQVVFFHYFKKHFSFERTWMIQFWIKLRVDWQILIYPEPMPTSSNPACKQSSWIWRHQSFKFNKLDLSSVVWHVPLDWKASYVTLFFYLGINFNDDDGTITFWKFHSDVRCRDDNTELVERLLTNKNIVTGIYFH